MKIILLDTNIYGLALEKKEVADILVFRKTMMNAKSIEVYTSINKKKGLRTPKFVGYIMLKGFLFRPGVS